MTRIESYRHPESNEVFEVRLEQVPRLGDENACIACNVTNVRLNEFASFVITKSGIVDTVKYKKCSPCVDASQSLSIDRGRDISDLTARVSSDLIAQA